MPLNTQIIRDGEPMTLRWSVFHVAAMVYAVSIDDPEGRSPFVDLDQVKADVKRLMEENEHKAIEISPRDAFQLGDYYVLGATALNEGEYTMQSETLRFIDVMDGEILEIRPGDKLVAYRGMR